MKYDDFIYQDDPIKTGNGKCGYLIIPKLCGAMPGEFGGYEYCDLSKCPYKDTHDNKSITKKG